MPIFSLSTSISNTPARSALHTRFLMYSAQLAWACGAWCFLGTPAHAQTPEQAPAQKQESHSKKPAFSVNIGRDLVIENLQGNRAAAFHESRALVIGAFDYDEHDGVQLWDDLSNAQEDMREVKGALQRQGFHVQTLENPTHQEFTAALNLLIKEYGQDEYNRILIYFAGHGYLLPPLDQEEAEGYIVFRNTTQETRKKFQESAYSLWQLHEIAEKQIKARQVMMIFDSCFSGSIFTAQRSGIIAPKQRPHLPDGELAYMASRPARQFITSGSANEKVPDNGLFREAFVDALDGNVTGTDADMYINDVYLTGTDLSKYLQKRVSEGNKGTHPLWSKGTLAEYQRGDFLFIRSNATHVPPLTCHINAGEQPMELHAQNLQNLQTQNQQTQNLQNLQSNVGICLPAPFALTPPTAVRWSLLSTGAIIFGAGLAADTMLPTSLDKELEPIDLLSVTGYTVGALTFAAGIMVNWYDVFDAPFLTESVATKAKEHE